LRPPSPPTLTTLTGTSTRLFVSIARASARAERSSPPPGGVPAMIAISRCGFQVFIDQVFIDQVFIDQIVIDYLRA
jgi:hypothetical protein